MRAPRARATCANLPADFLIFLILLFQGRASIPRAKCQPAKSKVPTCQLIFRFFSYSFVFRCGHRWQGQSANLPANSGRTTRKPATLVCRCMYVCACVCACVYVRMYVCMGAKARNYECVCVCMCVCVFAGKLSNSSACSKASTTVVKYVHGVSRNP